MIRKVALAAMTLLAAGAASAQSSVTLYGVVDVAVGRFETSSLGDSDATTEVASNVMTTSFIGFKGVEDLGNGLKGTFMLESFLRPDVGDAGRSDTDTFWARNANIGLAGDFGSVTVGRMDNLLFLSSLAFNPFGGSFGVSPTIRQTFGDVGLVLGDSGWSNTIKYVTPNLSGFTAAVQYQFKETTGTDNGNSWAANLTYLAGPFGITATYQNFKTASTAANPGAIVAGGNITPAATALSDVFANVPGTFTFGDEQKVWQLGASYDFGGAKLFGQYTDGTTEFDAGGSDLEAKQWQVGVSVPLGAGALLASYGQLKLESGAAEAKNKVFTIGYDYNLSKRTDVYAAYMYDKNSDNVAGNDWDSGNSFAVGVRHRF
ncbi:MAG: porin [Burkholderiales bacterium]|nr:porin [Burkholderiales bacterium]